jgi:hypothetical protein
MEMSQENPCRDFLNKQKCLFSKTGQEDKTGPIWGLAPVGGGRI